MLHFDLRNRYQIDEANFNGFPFFTVVGEAFDAIDLFELIGKKRFTATFNLKRNSDGLKEYGDSVTGAIFYSKAEKESLEAGSFQPSEKIKIIPYMADFDPSKIEGLKYHGIKLTDIQDILFTPDKTPKKLDSNGEKDVPNILRIPVGNDPRLDPDKLWQTVLAGKINAGKKLYDFEKEKLIGITLAINKDTIPTELPDALDYPLERIKASNEIWMHVYKTKKRRNIQLSEEEKKLFAEIEIDLYFEKMKKFTQELQMAQFKASTNPAEREILSEIIKSISEFQPSILLHGTHQVYWTIDSYIHIVLRHVKKFQFGAHKRKTHFPYKFEDLKILISKVLGTVEDEIQYHFETRPNHPFRLNGARNIPFNDDYYTLRIDQDGRLITIYAVE